MEMSQKILMLKFKATEIDNWLAEAYYTITNANSIGDRTFSPSFLVNFKVFLSKKILRKLSFYIKSSSFLSVESTLAIILPGQTITL